MTKIRNKCGNIIITFYRNESNNKGILRTAVCQQIRQHIWNRQISRKTKTTLTQGKKKKNRKPEQVLWQET